MLTTDNVLAYTTYTELYKIVFKTLKIRQRRGPRDLAQRAYDDTQTLVSWEEINRIQIPPLSTLLASRIRGGRIFTAL